MVDPYKSWLDAGVAEAMGALALEDLAKPDWETHPPFKYFLRAMERLGGAATLLDAGCGVGHYSEVLARRYPRVRYTGFDFSPHMVDEARRLWPGREFFVADMVGHDYAGHDVVLASSLIEVMDNWARGSEALCQTLTGKLVLHRVRVHGGPTVRNDTTGYPGQPTYTHVHNERELLNFYEERGLSAVWREYWTEHPQATYIFEKA